MSIKFQDRDHKRAGRVPIVAVAPAGVLRVPLAPGQLPLVARGAAVVWGQVIAEPHERFAVRAHASCSGVVTDVSAKEIAIAAAAQQPAAPVLLAPLPASDWTKEHVAARAREAGLLGQGGAGFPTFVKLSAAGIHTLVVNAVECEGYLTCDYRRMLESAAEVMSGVAIAARVLGAARVVVGYEPHYRAAIEALQPHAADLPVTWKCVGDGYPSGEGKLIIAAIGGPVIRRPAIEQDFGYIVLNVNTLYRLARAVLQGEPLTRRTMTLGGGLMLAPGNFDVPIGLSLAELFRQTGNDALPAGQPLRLGGPMMSPETIQCDTPVTQRSLGVLALPSAAVPTCITHCIGCFRCKETCPVGLSPNEFHYAVRDSNTAALRQLHLEQCIECGSCEYACPVNVPLIRAIQDGKHALNQRSMAFAPPALHHAARYLPDCFHVALALLPLLLFSCWQWGWSALAVWLAGAIGAVGAEWVFYRISKGTQAAWECVRDCTALVTGLVLAASLPAGFPPLLVAVAAGCGLLFMKLLNGGVGKNMFNPAMVARAALLFLVPRAMTTWPAPRHAAIDALTTATPLGHIHEHGADYLVSCAPAGTLLRELLVGNHAGSLGEVSIVLCLIAGAYLIALRIVKWQTPLLFIGGFVLAFLAHHVATGHRPDWYLLAIHLCSGALVVGSIFYVTDYVGASNYRGGRYFLMLCAGALTYLLRERGYYPEGVCYAILAAQMLRPVSDLIGRALLVHKQWDNVSTLLAWTRGHALRIIAGGALAALTVLASGMLPRADARTCPAVWPACIRAAASNAWGWRLTAEVPGYNAPMVVAFDVTRAGIISNLCILSCHETRGIGSTVAGERGAAFRHSFDGRHFDDLALRGLAEKGETDEGTVDGISGATISCNNIVLGVRNAVNDFNDAVQCIAEEGK